MPFSSFAESKERILKKKHDSNTEINLACLKNVPLAGPLNPRTFQDAMDLGSGGLQLWDQALFPGSLWASGKQASWPPFGNEQPSRQECHGWLVATH